MRICVARLRERAKYTRPLEHILDVFYFCLKRYTSKHKEHQYTFYNCSFDGSKPVRDVGTVAAADVVVIPSEQEFHYHTPGYFHTLDVARSHQFVAEVEPHVNGKHVVLLRFDRADDETLYRGSTFPRINFRWSCIDEMDFPKSINGLKYHFITGYMNSHPMEFLSSQRNIDFCYWGSCKNKGPNGKDYGDVRHKVLKAISKSTAACLWIGRYPNFKRDKKMAPLGKLLSDLIRCKATMCFNWLDDTATTARYHEAVATGIIPFVWQNYDCNNTLVVADWQRITTPEELTGRLRQLRNETVYKRMYGEVLDGYKVPTKDEYCQMFDDLLTKTLDT